MRFEVSRTDFQLLTSVLTLLREKGGRNPSLSREEIIRESGFSNAHLSQKIHNVHLKQKQLKENIA